MKQTPFLVTNKWLQLTFFGLKKSPNSWPLPLELYVFRHINWQFKEDKLRSIRFWPKAGSAKDPTPWVLQNHKKNRNVWLIKPLSDTKPKSCIMPFIYNSQLWKSIKAKTPQSEWHSILDSCYKCRTTWQYWTLSWEFLIHLHWTVSFWKSKGRRQKKPNILQLGWP